MKYLLPTLLLSIVFSSCNKKNCQTCTSYVLSPVFNGGGTVTHDTIYANQEFCEKELQAAKAEDKKQTKVTVGSTTYTFTTIVNCR